MTRLTLTAALVLMATPALSETRMERFEALAESMNTAMLGMMVNEIEGAGGDASALKELDGMMPPWTDEMRVAASCMLDEYTADVGEDGVDSMFARMDAALPQMADLTMTEATENGLLDSMSPEGVSVERTMEINESCGMMELQQEATQNSGFMEALMEAGATVPE